MHEMLTLYLTALLLLVISGYALPYVKDSTFVVLTDEYLSSMQADQAGTLDEPKIYEMHVNTYIANRFASTLVTSKVINYDVKAHQATFTVVIPDSAYITEFTMEIRKKKYTAHIKEKDEAKQIYNKAVASGRGAAHVSTVRHSNRFSVDVNIEPQSNATFYLFYEELLKRLQTYEHVVNIQVSRPVPDFTIDVYINETSKLTMVKAPNLRSGNEIPSKETKDLDPRAIIEWAGGSSVHVYFNPSEVEQKEYAKKLKNANGAFYGQFVVQYDVERVKNGGEVFVKDGYFVHFFAPSNLAVMPKYIVFVLDTSGSMAHGRKMAQLKQAMVSILKNLNQDDTFSLVDFNSNVQVWDINDKRKNAKCSRRTNINKVVFPKAHVYNNQNTNKAINVVNIFEAKGGTNIYKAFEVAMRLIQLNKEGLMNVHRQPMIMFLTDGEPTEGITNPDVLIAKLSQANVHQTPIYSLSFGDKADRKFMNRISLENRGFARHIYESSDAALQLQDFYKQISSPLLADVKFKYANNAREVTRNNFTTHFQGSELVICGKYNSKAFGAVQVTGVTKLGKVTLTPTIENPIGDMERVWAYVTIQQLLEEQEKDMNDISAKRKALELALKYSFVTPLTSLVVVNPNEANSQAKLVAADKKIIPRSSFSGPVAGVGLGIRMGDDDTTTDMPPPTLQPIPDFGTIYNSTEVLQFLKTKLSWLLSHIVDNDKIEVRENGTTIQYSIHGVGSETNACENPPKNSTGTCKFLYNCQQSFNDIQTFEVFEEHMCKLDNNKYIGICCPDPTVQPVA